MAGQRPKGWKLLKAALATRKSATMLAFGFSSGLPFALLIGTLTAWLGEVGVKQGETISSGEVIGKVGDSGGVTEPQLHFELRRGKRPVDPKEFLAPAPSAGSPVGNAAG